MTLDGRDARTIQRLREKYGDEQVLVLPYTQCENIPDHYTAVKNGKFVGKVNRMGRFVLRAEAEGNVSVLQIIPYAVVRDTKGRYFISRRIKGDERLQGSLSIGFGGHINPIDKPDPVNNGMLRELNEELDFSGIKEGYATCLRGTVRDMTSSTPDHIGIVYEVVVEEDDADKLKIRETDTLAGEWMTTRQLIQNFSRFESWAQLIIAHNTIGRKETA